MEKKSNVRLAAANMLLDRGVRFNLSGAPWYWRLLGLSRIHIRPLRAGTIMEISRVMDESGLSEICVQKDANGRIDSVALVIAIAILNDKRKIERFSGMLAKWLLWKVPASVIRDIYMLVAKLNKVSDFMNITIYFGMQAQMMMNPKDMGRKRMGS